MLDELAKRDKKREEEAIAKELETIRDRAIKEQEAKDKAAKGATKGKKGELD